VLTTTSSPVVNTVESAAENELKVERLKQEEAAYVTFQQRYGKNQCSASAFDPSLQPKLRELVREMPKLMHTMLQDLEKNGTEELLEEKSNITDLMANLEGPLGEQIRNEPEKTDFAEKRKIFYCILELKHERAPFCPRPKISTAIYEPAGGYLFRSEDFGGGIRYADLILPRTFTETHYVGGSEKFEIPSNWKPYDITMEYAIYRSQEQNLLSTKALSMADAIKDVEAKDRLSKTIATKLAFATAFAAATHGLSLAVSGGSAAADISQAGVNSVSEATQSTIGISLWEGFRGAIVSNAKIEGQNRLVDNVNQEGDDPLKIQEGAGNNSIENKKALLRELFNKTAQLEKLRGSARANDRATFEDIRDFYNKFDESITGLKSVSSTVGSLGSAIRFGAPVDQSYKIAPLLDGIQRNVSFSGDQIEHDSDFNLSNFIPRIIELEAAEKERCQLEALAVYRSFDLKKGGFLSFDNKRLSTDEATATKAVIKLIELEEACFLRRLTLRLAKINLFQRAYDQFNQFCHTLK